MRILGSTSPSAGQPLGTDPHYSPQAPGVGHSNGRRRRIIVRECRGCLHAESDSQAARLWSYALVTRCIALSDSLGIGNENHSGIGNENQSGIGNENLSDVVMNASQTSLPPALDCARDLALL